MLKVRVAESEMGVDLTIPTSTEANMISLVKAFASANPHLKGGAAQVYEKVYNNILEKFKDANLKDLSKKDAEIEKKKIVNAEMAKITDPTAAQRGRSLNHSRPSGGNKMRDALSPDSKLPGGTF